jgi:hypothetical protein
MKSSGFLGSNAVYSEGAVSELPEFTIQNAAYFKFRSNLHKLCRNSNIVTDLAFPTQRLPKIRGTSDMNVAAQRSGTDLAFPTQQFSKYTVRI